MRSDPIGLGGGLNTFGYVVGSPLMGIDPLGLVYGAGADNVTQSPGPFNGQCGAEGSISAHWLPDIGNTNACKEHDKCYSTCGKTKLQCDDEFIDNGAFLYGNGLKKVFTRISQNAYDDAQKQAGCDDCENK